jgi:glycosyltransferase involved in cell wall biosynthesis
MSPAISVVIPTYNRPGALCELLYSLLQQTYQDFEIILVNDAGQSIDFTKKLYPELPLKIINLEVNQKHVHARNYGLEEANAEYILLCDDDDLLLPCHIETMVEQIEDADLVYSDVEIFGYKMVNERRIPTSRRLFAYDDDLVEMRRFSTFVSSGCLYRRSIHERIGYFDIEVYHYWDWDFFLRVADQFRIKRVPRASVLYAFSQEGDNMSANLVSMQSYLDRLARKHQLGKLPTENFFTLLDEPAMRAREAESKILWDGSPFGTRRRLNFLNKL